MNCNSNVGLTVRLLLHFTTLLLLLLLQLFFPRPSAEPLTEAEYRVKRMMAKMRSGRLPTRLGKRRSLFSSGKYHCKYSGWFILFSSRQRIDMLWSPKKQDAQLWRTPKLKPGHFLSEGKRGNAIWHGEAGRQLNSIHRVRGGRDQRGTQTWWGFAEWEGEGNAEIIEIGLILKPRRRDH